MWQTLPIHLRIYKDAKGWFHIIGHKYVDQISNFQLNMVLLCIFEPHNVSRFINLKCFLSKIFLVLGIPLLASLCKFLFFFVFCSHNIVGTIRIAEGASKSRGKNCNRLEIFPSYSSDSFPKGFSLQEYEYQDNNLFSGKDAFL